MDDVTNAAQKARHWIARRDAAICAAHQRGESLRAIGARAGLSHVAVLKITRAGAASKASRASRGAGKGSSAPAQGSKGSRASRGARGARARRPAGNRKEA